MRSGVCRRAAKKHTRRRITQREKEHKVAYQHSNSKCRRRLATLLASAAISVLLVSAAAVQGADSAVAARAKYDEGSRICYKKSGVAWIKVTSKGDTYVWWSVGRSGTWKKRYYNDTLRARYINTHLSRVDVWAVKVLNKNGYLYTQSTYGFCA